MPCCEDTPESRLELVGLVYAGVLEAVPWTALLERLRLLLAANFVSLAVRSPTPGDPGLVIFAGHARPAIALTYERSWYALDPFVDLPCGQMLMLHERLDERRWLDSAIYRDLLRELDIRHVMGADLDLEGGRQSRLRVTRPPSMAPFAEAHRSLCAFLLPHLQRSLRLYARLDRAESECRLQAATLERLGVGTLLLDAHGEVLQCSAVASQLLAAGHGLTLKGRRLRAANGLDERRLERAVQRLLAARTEGAGNAAQALALGSGTRGLGVLLRGLPFGKGYAGEAALEVIIRDPLSRPEPSEALLRQLYQLTPAEAGLAALLCHGQSLEQAAGALTISRNTARAHLRVIFSKTGVSRQADLVQLLLGSVAAFSPEGAGG